MGALSTIFFIMILLVVLYVGYKLFIFYTQYCSAGVSFFGEDMSNPATCLKWFYISLFANTNSSARSSR